MTTLACSAHLLSYANSDQNVIFGLTAPPGRVCGNLAVSRALGDFVYKDRADLQPHEQKMSAAADLTVVQRDPEDQVLIVACDGIWDVMTNEQAVSYVLRSARSGNSPAEVSVRACRSFALLQQSDRSSFTLRLGV